MRGGCTRGIVLASVLCLAPPSVTLAQFDDSLDLPGEVPPPLPPREPPDNAQPQKPIVPQDEDQLPALGPDLVQKLKETARIYQDFAKRFTCDESARIADYNASGEANEKIRNYAYTLLSDQNQHALREYRQEQGRDGKLKGVVDDPEPFPPAYMWVMLFTEFHEPYFAFRDAGTRFDGFDLVREIHFKGSLPWTDGRDIRQWEGRILVDALRFTPLLLEAQPSGQRERLEALYRLWSQSFNVLGFRTKKSPLGYRAAIQFRFQKNGLNFPTELRYDTERAVSTHEVVPVKTSTRVYKNYRFFDTWAEPEVITPPSS